MALVLHGAAQETPQATLDPQQQVVFNSLTAIRAASTGACHTATRINAP